MSRELFASKLVDTEARSLHLVLPRTSKCTHCNASKFAMKFFYTSDEQTWLNVHRAMPSTILHDDRGDEFVVVSCRTPTWPAPRYEIPLYEDI
jgi:hypothetical protein